MSARRTDWSNGPATEPTIEVVDLDDAGSLLARAEVLDAEERGRAAAFRRAQDRDRYLVGHVLTRLRLGERLGVAPAAVPLRREACTHCGRPHGKPVVVGAEFSLSGSGRLVAFAIAEAPVGLDVEVVPAPEEVEVVAGMLHPREHAELTGLDRAGRPQAFARCWTRKEAVLKASGLGLNEGAEEPYVGVGTRPAAVPGWALRDVAVPTGYAAAVAVAAVSEASGYGVRM